MRNGKVYLVGAGPGDPELLTVRAVRLLNEADVVIYDRLVQPSVLKLASSRAKIIPARTHAAGSRSSQDTINAIMVSEARRGRSVVRLKGGDPFVFGRGGEEAEALARNKIEFEFVPGVSSAIAAAAYAGIPVTHRLHSSSVLIVTGHEAPGKTKRVVDWKKVAGSADTIVILMAAGSFSHIARDLMRGGLTKSTPVAAVENASTAGQKVRLFTLGSASRRRRILNPPTVVVVGRVASLAKTLDWFRVDGQSTIYPDSEGGSAND